MGPFKSDEEDNLILLLGGVLEFGYKISTLINTSILGGLAHLRTLIGGGVTWYRGKENIKGPQWICFGGAALRVGEWPHRVL